MSSMELLEQENHVWLLYDVLGEEFITSLTTNGGTDTTDMNASSLTISTDGSPMTNYSESQTDIPTE